MKALTFIHSFYSKIRFSAVILFIMITISVLSLVLTTGVIRYYAYQYNLIKDVDIENGVYIMRSVENEWGRNSEEEVNYSDL